MRVIEWSNSRIELSVYFSHTSSRSIALNIRSILSGIGWAGWSCNSVSVPSFRKAKSGIPISFTEIIDEITLSLHSLSLIFLILKYAIPCPAIDNALFITFNLYRITSRNCWRAPFVWLTQLSYCSTLIVVVVVFSISTLNTNQLNWWNIARARLFKGSREFSSLLLFPFWTNQEKKIFENPPLTLSNQSRKKILFPPFLTNHKNFQRSSSQIFLKSQ